MNTEPCFLQQVIRVPTAGELNDEKAMQLRAEPLD
jgi:hypothetical protein